MDKEKRRMNTRKNICLAVVVSAIISGCSTVPSRPVPPKDLASIPNAVPKLEPRSTRGNPDSYKEFGKRYWILSSPFGYVARGKASWYGGKFHGRETSSGEIYDMYAMTAAHKTLPIPCYARVTNLENGRSIVVKINDRGPFVDGRIVDLSYVAASKLGMVEKGTAEVELRVIDPRREAPPTQFAKAAPAKPAAPVVIPQPKTVTTPKPVVVAKPTSAPVNPVSGVIVPALPKAVTAAPEVVAAASVPTQAEPVKPAIQPVALKEPVKEVVKPAPITVAKTEEKAGLKPGVYIQLGAFSSSQNAEKERSRLQSFQSNPVQVETANDALGRLYRVLVGPFESESSAMPIASRLKYHGYDQYRLVPR